MIELQRLTDIDRLMEWRREVLTCVFGSAPDSALLAANVTILSDMSAMARILLS